MIIQLFEHIYYQLFRTIKKSGSSVPIESASTLFAFVQMLNFTAILLILSKILNFDLLAKIGEISFVFMFIGLMILNITFIRYKKRYQLIIEKKRILTEKQNQKYWIMTLVYMVISFFIVLI